MKAAELLISARGLPWQKLVSLADRGSMRALAIMRQFESQVHESSESPTTDSLRSLPNSKSRWPRRLCYISRMSKGAWLIECHCDDTIRATTGRAATQRGATPEPTETEVLIKLYASSVNPLDGFTIRGPLFFFPKLGKLLKPKHKIAGADFAGRVESVGRDIKLFRPGDEVFGASFRGKGLGGFAEYVCAREDSLAAKPSNLSFEEAADSRWPFEE